MTYKIAPLTVNPQNNSPVLSRVFVSQPSAEEEMLVGRLFVLLEIEMPRATDERVADAIISEAYRQYYENEALVLRDRLSHIKPDVIFEASIAKLNRGLAEFLEQEKISLRPDGLNAIVGVLFGNKLLFAQAGTGKALLLYRPKNKKGEFLPDFSLVDITEKTNDPTQEIAQPNKFFTNIVAGTVPAHGYFFFANESLFEYLTKKQLTDIITTLPPAGAAEQIKNLLEQTNAFVPFFGLIIKNTTGEHDAFAAPAATIAVPGTTPVGLGRSSVQQFNLTQEKTEQLLNPSGVINLKKWLQRLAPISGGIKKYATDTGRRFNVATERAHLGEKLIVGGKKVFVILAALASLIISGVNKLWRLAANREERKNFVSQTKTFSQSAIKGTAGLVDKFLRLQPKHKALVSIIGICVIALLVNVIYSGITSRQRAADEQYTAITSQFNQKTGQLEAALLYNNRDFARQILDEMSTLLSTAPQRSQKDKNRFNELRSRYESMLDKLYTTTRIASDAQSIKLPGAARYLLANETIILAISQDAKAVWKINRDLQTIDVIGSDNFPTGNIVGASIEDANYYYIGARGVGLYEPLDEKTSVINIDNAAENIAASAVYNNRLYAAANGTIYRYNLDERLNVFTGRQAWLRDENIGTISSIAIDGRIYAVEGNGISKFSTGRRETLSLDPVSPALESPTMVGVSTDLDYLYILEPKHKRLLVYSKTGSYIAQYTGDHLSDLRAFTVDQKEKTIYLLNGDTLIKTPATHFK